MNGLGVRCTKHGGQKIGEYKQEPGTTTNILTIVPSITSPSGKCVDNIRQKTCGEIKTSYLRGMGACETKTPICPNCNFL